MQLQEVLGEPYVGNLTRARQVNGEVGNRAGRRPGGEHDDPVRERDCLLEVVGDEEDGFAVC